MSKTIASDLPPLDFDGWALFLDYDGTLVPIAPTPSEAVADDVLRSRLVQLQAGLDGALAVVTGRPVADIDQFLAPLRLTVAGLHGLQLRLRDGELIEHAPPAALLDAARAELGALVERYPGTLLEDKRLSLALHFRQAPEAGPVAEAVAGRLAEQSSDLLRIQRGKMVVELLPSGRDKGRAIVDLLRCPDFVGRRPIFVGDDVTDEAGFRAVNELGGCSIRIGVPDTVTDASHVIADIAGFRAWLARSLPQEGA